MIYQEVDGGFTSPGPDQQHVDAADHRARHEHSPPGPGELPRRPRPTPRRRSTQTVSATNDVNSEASAEIANDGTLNIQALAFASGAGAAALATFTSDAIVQTVDECLYRRGDNQQQFRPGTLDILAQATAIADEGAAIASAYLYTVVSQSVSATDDTGSIATASMTNDGTFNIQVLAKALGQTAATAIATMGYRAQPGPRRGLHGASPDKQCVNGHDRHPCPGDGQRPWQVRPRQRRPLEYTVISQSVTATGDAGSTATASITNEGSFNIHANAKADGQFRRRARFAQFSDTGIHQDVSDAPNGRCGDQQHIHRNPRCSRSGDGHGIIRRARRWRAPWALPT